MMSASGQQSWTSDRTLEQSEARFRTLLEAVPQIAFVISRGGRAECCNRAFVEFAGERNDWDTAALAALVHPEDRDGYDTARSAGVAAGEEYVVEARLRRHDGAYRWHRLHNRPLQGEDGRVDWLGTADDIDDARHERQVLEQRVQERTTALEATIWQLRAEVEDCQQVESGLRESEARYRNLYNRTPVALQSTDAEALLIDVNDTWIELFGYGREQVIGHSPAEFMTPESATVYQRRAWPEMLASRGEPRIVDYQFVTRTGQVFDARIAARGEFDAAGRFVRTWSAIADVTAQKRADRALHQAHRMEAVGQLTAGIAHDFNNLLTAILGNLELMAKRPPPDPGRPNDLARTDRLIRGARDAAERGARLTAQLLSFSRQQPIMIEPIDVNHALGAMRPLLQGTIGATIAVEFTLDPALHTALADLTQLEMAVLNLAINARDAMPQGGAITIGTANVTRDAPARPEEPEPGDYIAVTVADTGSGIADMVRDRIFEPFFTTKEIGRGSGLGLAQLLGIAKQLGGGVSVQSAPDEGTAVTVFLPRAGDGAVRTASVAADEGSGPALDAPTHVLRVDDDPAVRATTAELLRDSGHEVVAVGSAGAALDHLERGEGCVALMLIDVAMPRMNGVELAKIVRRAWPALPILFMTGYAEPTLLPDDAWRAVLRKPFTAAELTVKVGQALKAAPA